MSHAQRTGLLRRGRAGCGLTALVAAVLFASTSAAHATVTAENHCQSGRANAAAQYMSCAEKALVKYYLRPSGDILYVPVAYETAAGKCVTKYAGAWARLQAKASGTGATCDSSRFVDNGDGTVTDRLTALQWEKKTNLDGTENFADPHDADNDYSWSAAGAGGTNRTAADGTAFTTFLLSLNSGGCFAEQCDWRLPTRDELLTIATPQPPRPCTTGPCIDPALGPTVAGTYWSATTLATDPVYAWGVDFKCNLNTGVSQGEQHGSASQDLKDALDLYVRVRAVRSGL